MDAVQAFSAMLPSALETEALAALVVKGFAIKLPSAVLDFLAIVEHELMASA